MVWGEVKVYQADVYLIKTILISQDAQKVNNYGVYTAQQWSMPFPPKIPVQRSKRREPNLLLLIIVTTALKADSKASKDHLLPNVFRPRIEYYFSRRG